MICRICNQDKDLLLFTKRGEKYRTECKSCQSENNKKYREKNAEVLKEKVKIRYEQNKEVRKQKERKRYQLKKEQIKAKVKDYYLSNKDKIKEQRKIYAKKKLATDNIFKTKRNLRNRLWYALSNKGWKKNTNFNKYIGLDDCAQLVSFLEKNFKDGMSWENYGNLWDIDHIVPLSLASTEEQLHQLCNYKNLVPMNKIENRVVKRDKFDFNKEYSVKLIDYSVGQEFLLKNHYLHRKAPSEYTFGLFLRNNELVGVCTFHTPFSPGLKRMFGEENKNDVIELNRLALLDFLPKNSESWFVAKCLNSKLIKKRIIVSFADTTQNHNGTIYKALNFIYTGLTKKKKNMTVGDGRHAISVGLNYDKSKLKYEDRSQKHRYVYFNGSKSYNKRMKKAMQFLTRTASPN